MKGGMRFFNAYLLVAVFGTHRVYKVTIRSHDFIDFMPDVQHSTLWPQATILFKLQGGYSKVKTTIPC